MAMTLTFAVIWMQEADELLLNLQYWVKNPKPWRFITFLIYQGTDVRLQMSLFRYSLFVSFFFDVWRFKPRSCGSVSIFEEASLVIMNPAVVLRTPPSCSKRLWFSRAELVLVLNSQLSHLWWCLLSLCLLRIMDRSASNWHSSQGFFCLCFFLYCACPSLCPEFQWSHTRHKRLLV